VKREEVIISEKKDEIDRFPRKGATDKFTECV
jgi:hypothetical protein